MAAKPFRSAAVGADASTADDAMDVVDRQAVIDDLPTPKEPAPPSADLPSSTTAEPPVQAATWPVSITVRNHSALSICDPLSGLFLPPGQASDNVVLRNPEHAAAVLGNLREIVRINQLGSQIELIGVPANF